MDKLIEKSRAQYGEKQAEKIEKAFLLSQKLHAGQKRDSGEDYFTHPYEVANILLGLGMDADTVCAGLMHDVVEDVPNYEIEDVERDLGHEVASLVEGVTKLENIKLDMSMEKSRRDAENIRKIIVAMSQDIRVILIKLADRLHNMRTLEPCTPEKQKHVSKETLEIYAPLSARLGIYSLKWELEDLAFKYLYPKEYFELAAKVNRQRQEREKDVEVLMGEIRELLEKNNIKADIQGRPKHLYSIYNKLKETPFEKIYDLLAVRIIVETKADCYLALGVVHNRWRILNGRLKDYISSPKVNMYQSLHTTVLSDNDVPFEVQIRTREMHHTAEYGIAAHWKYKEGGKGDDLGEKLSWLRSILEVQDEMNDAEEFVDALKIDLYSDEVMVFTPKWKVIVLPKGAIPIDFAYRIHSDVGNHCVGAKVNGKMVPLTYQLQTGDVCEILTQPNRGPSLDWKDVVKTAAARSKILGYFRRVNREENIDKGRDMLELAAKRAGYPVASLLKSEWIELIGESRRLKGTDDVYAAVGCGALGVGYCISRLITEYNKVKKPHTEQRPGEGLEREQDASAQDSDTTPDIIVKGEDNMLVRLAHCCTPVYGDNIVGYITRGRGVSVHRSDCKNVQNLSIEPERFIAVEWKRQHHQAYSADIQVVSLDRPRLLFDISALMSDMQKSFTAINARSSKEGLAIVNFTIQAESADQLDEIMNKLRALDKVIEVTRENVL